MTTPHTLMARLNGHATGSGHATITRSHAPTGYGIARDKMYNQFQVPADSTSLDINCLNKGVPYCFTIESFNENGVTHSFCIRECN